MKKLIFTCIFFVFFGVMITVAQEGPWFVFDLEETEQTIIVNVSRADTSKEKIVFAINIERYATSDDYIDIQIDWGEDLNPAEDYIDIKFALLEERFALVDDFVYWNDVNFECKGLKSGKKCRLSPKNSAFLISRLDEIESLCVLYSNKDEGDSEFIFSAFDTRGLMETLDQFENQENLKQLRMILSY